MNVDGLAQREHLDYRRKVPRTKLWQLRRWAGKSIQQRCQRELESGGEVCPTTEAERTLSGRKMSLVPKLQSSQRDSWNISTKHFQ